MNGIDWVIVAIAAVFAAWGYMQGIIVGGLSLGGFALGAVIGSRIGPLILPKGSHSVYAPLFGLVGAVLVGALLATGLEGLGMRVRFSLRIPVLKFVDGVLGAALTACIGLGIAWIVGAVALHAITSPALRRDLQHSAILRDLNQVLPPSGAILHALSTFDPLPSLNGGPSANVPKPTKTIEQAPRVRAADASVVRVLGTACGLGIEGSGWVAAPGLVVTNAHVVAGENDTTVSVGGSGPQMPVRVILFDPHEDIALLRVAGLSERPLPLAAAAKPGTSAAILGYPEDGPFDVEAGRIGETQTVSTENAYGNGPVLRSITALRGLVRPGNSGGPMVDSRGQVVATVFGQVTNPARGTGPGGFAVPDSIVRDELDRAGSASRAVSTQGCAD